MGLNRSGANERNRTADLLITSELLYQLSYIGTEKRARIKPKHLGEVKAIAWR